MSVIETSKIIELSECNLETKTLLTGTLLKWMDVIACLSAEKQANVPCVTASVDDLQLMKTISLGQVLLLKAWINRSFNTSMEVEVSVKTEDTTTMEEKHICQAFFTFVTQPDENGKKQLVKPVLPESKKEKTQFRLANERKKMRLEYRASLKRLDESFDDGGFSFDEDVFEDTESVDAATTACTCVEIVLPQHANHHQTTFGGQLMAWMESAGTISARRLCHSLPRLVAVDEVFFRAPSKVGDRIVIQSSVNNTFDKSMEVGVRVEAYAVGGETRHIQSAYFTFIAPDGTGNLKQLPKIAASSKKHFQRMMRAEERVRLRTERRSILRSVEPLVSVPLTKHNQKILSYKNILALMELYNSPGFKLKVQTDEIRLYQCKLNDRLCIRIECEINVPSATVYKVLSDHKKRTIWDMAVTKVSIARIIREDEDCVLHYAMQNLSPRENVKGDDFVVLASTRKDIRELHTIAYRSVTVADLPPLPEYNRAQTRCSGFVLEAVNNTITTNGCKIVYLNQVTDHVYQYIKHDLEGATNTLAKRAIAIKELVRQSVP